MTHTNDAQTVHTRQTRSVCKPRPPAYIQGTASITSTITSDPRPVFEARLVYKAGFYSRKYGNSRTETEMRLTKSNMELIPETVN